MEDDFKNKENFIGLEWILDVAQKGFFFILASHRMQERIAEDYTADNIAKLNYSDRSQYNDFRFFDEENTEHYKFRVIDKFVYDNNDKQIFFIINFQIPFPAVNDIYNLNMSRDMIADLNKVFIFFMTPELEQRLFQSARDFHDYCNLKIRFEDIGMEETKQELKNLNENVRTINQIHDIKERLARYKEMETEYLSYFEETPKGIVLLKKDLSDSQLLAIANTLDNIAELYHKTCDYPHALSIHKKTLLLREEILGLKHSDTATSYNNIGFVYDTMGDYKKALEYYNKALEIWEKVLGLEHPDTTISYNNIGSIYDNTGDYNKALKYHNKALEIRKKVLGLEHPDTATSYNNIGFDYNNTGDYNRALEYYNKALEIRKKVLGFEHPDTATSYNNIGAVYNNTCNYDKALEYYNKALEIRKKVLGLEHPFTATSYNNIGLVYNNTGNYSKALEYYNKALKIVEKVLGKEHPNTKTVLENIELISKKYQ